MSRIFLVEATTMTSDPAIPRSSASAAPAVPSPDPSGLGERFVRAVAERDFPALSSCFAQNARFRALVPCGLRQADGAEEPVHFFQSWFGAAQEVVLLGSRVEGLADRVHLSWRLRVHEAGEVWVVEQQAYASAREDRFTEVDLLCSGFRGDSSHGAAGVCAHDVPGFAVAATLDGGAAGCATLTPLVKARLRDLASGEVLEIVSSEPTAAQDLASWSALTGHAVIATRAEAARTRFFVRKK